MLSHPDLPSIVSSFLGAWRVVSDRTEYEFGPRFARACTVRSLRFDLVQDENGTRCDIVKAVEFFGLVQVTPEADWSTLPRRSQSIEESITSLEPVYGPHGPGIAGRGKCFCNQRMSYLDMGETCVYIFSRQEEALLVQLSYLEDGAIVTRTFTAMKLSEAEANESTSTTAPSL